MLFCQKRNIAAKGPKWVGMRQQTWQMDGGEFVCYKCFSWEPFYCVQMNPLCKLYIEPYGKNYMYQADTGALNKNKVQYGGECEWNVS